MAEQVNDSQERLLVLRELIREGKASTQEELGAALTAKKFSVTQSTVSRDLRRLGAVKTTNAEGQIIYVLPEDHQVLGQRVAHNLTGLITELQSNEGMIVIHTSPGSASLVARHLDSLRNTIGILGTLAGDDAIFVIPASVKKIPLVVRRIKEEFF